MAVTLSLALGSETVTACWAVTVPLRLAGEQVATGKANRRGASKVRVAAPVTKKTRKVKIKAIGSLPDRKGRTKVRIKATPIKLRLAEAGVRASDAQQVTVTGLTPGERVRITYQDRVRARGTANANGRFTARLDVGQAWGRFTVKATAVRTNRTATATFTVYDRFRDRR